MRSPCWQFWFLNTSHHFINFSRDIRPDWFWNRLGG
jgi:hypothetical protein